MKKAVLALLLLMATTISAQVRPPNVSSNTTVKTLAAGASHSVTLAWNQPAQPGGETVASTNVYRNGTKIGSVPIASPFQYIDTSVAAGVSYNYSFTNVDTKGVEGVQSASVAVTIPNNAFVPIRIKPMTTYTDSTGSLWSLDTSNCTGGNTSHFSNAISKALPSASDQALYQSERYQTSTCTFSNLPAGTYDVTIKESENFWTVPGKRVFSVAINGTTVWPNIDLFTLAGGEFIAYDKVLPVTLSATGNIVVQFIDGPTGSADVNAKYDAIQVTVGSPLVSIVVSPSSASILTEKTVQFSVTVTGTTNQAVTWSANAPNGLFTAAVPGTFTVTATSVVDPTKSSFATVTVTAAPVTLNCPAVATALGGGYSGQIVTVGQLPSGPTCTFTLP